MTIPPFLACRVKYIFTFINSVTVTEKIPIQERNIGFPFFLLYLYITGWNQLPEGANGTSLVKMRMF
jgi:hypothetical protein